MPALEQERATNPWASDHQRAPELASASPLQAEEKTEVDPNSPSEASAASGSAIDSLAAPDASMAEGKSPAESKQARVLALLRSPQGATIAAMTSVTYWQAHSVRGFLTSVVRQKLGLNLTSEKVDGERRYHITHDVDPGGAPSIDQSSPSASRSAVDVPLGSPAKVAE